MVRPRVQDVELSPADLHALAAARLDAWLAANSNAEGFEVREPKCCHARRALHLQASDSY